MLVGFALLAGGLAADALGWVHRRGGRLVATPRRRRLLVGAALAAAAAAVSWFGLGVPVVSLLATLAGAVAPYALVRSRRGRDRRELERAWAAALDQLADALETGLGFPAAASFVANAGPPPLRARFATLAETIRRGELDEALAGLARAPEQSARTCAALLRAALVELPTGGLVPLLRELAQLSRDRFEAHERAALRALALRREATILAASPLAFLLLIGWSAPGYLDAYRGGAGSLVSLAGALAIGACYAAMLRLGRIPEPGSRR